MIRAENRGQSVGSSTVIAKGTTSVVPLEVEEDAALAAEGSFGSIGLIAKS